MYRFTDPSILAYSGLHALGLCALIVSSLFANPRLWIHDLPKDLQSRIPAKTVAEQRLTNLVGIPFFIFVIGFPIFAVLNLTQAGILSVGDPLSTFAVYLVVIYLMNFVFNLADLLVIDWFLICWWTPKFIQVPGLPGHLMKNYRYHGKAFFRGLLVIVFPSLISASIALGINLWNT